jgi:BirA family biotin operon repressor/biotin-[acetyl-CoA-carboxylase] ligase
VCEAFPEADGIKWPNDVWVDGRKVAGILIEGRPQDGWAVLGIGLNVAVSADEFPEELRGVASSLTSVDTPAEALAPLLPALDAWLDAPGDDVLRAWRSRDALLGERVSWGNGSGVAAGIDDSGCLLVDTDGGQRALRSGEVHLRRPD